MVTSKKIRRHKSKNNAFDFINIGLLILLSLSIILPFVVLISQSLTSTEDIVKYGLSLFPKRVVFDSYKFLLVENYYIYQGVLTSVFITVAGTSLSLIFTSTLSYGLSKKYLPYRNKITLFVFFTMIFSGGLIPTYMLVTGLGMRNSLLACFIPTIINPWFMFIMRNFFMELPHELEESAIVDGANPFIIFLKIFIPLSLPALATIGLFYAVAYWNSWFPAAIYLTSKDKWPMQLILRDMISSLDIKAMMGGAELDNILWNMPKESIKAAAIMITSLPIICIYPFAQKYFVKGVLIGSVKG